LIPLFVPCSVFCPNFAIIVPATGAIYSAASGSCFAGISFALTVTIGF